MKEVRIEIRQPRRSFSSVAVRFTVLISAIYLFLASSQYNSWTARVTSAYNGWYKGNVKVLQHGERVILSNGVSMPILAAGTWQYTDDVAEKSVIDSLEAGYRHIDTAYNYFNQAGVGQGIRSYLENHPDLERFDIFLTTKVPPCGTYGVSMENCGDDTHNILQKNLDLLGFSHVDLILIHFPPKFGGCGGENCEALRHQYKALQHAFMTKKTRSIGVSNFCQECIDCIMSWPELYIMPVVNQVEYHVGMGADPEGIISYSESQGMVVQAYSPLGNNNPELIKGDDLSAVARRYGKTVPQVALKWVVENNVTLVTKSRESAHMRQNLDMFSWQLSQKDMAILSGKTEPEGRPMC